jgi:transcription elongation factor Elf1
MSLGPLKTCFKCGVERPICEFYRHSQMADGHLNKCKACTKADTTKNRQGKIDYYRAYDRERQNEPHRVAARNEYNPRWIAKHPDRRKAQGAVATAVKSGRLIRLPCLICGERAEAHHPDYNAPLDVVWLCRPHHMQAHALVGGNRNETQGGINGEVQ